MTLRIERDRLGIPRVRAASTLDAFFGQGYAHAADRLWQMEFDRLRAAGEVASIVGRSYLTYDIYLRRLQLFAAAARDVAAVTPETRDVLDAYSAGVNAGVAAMDELPIEFALLGRTPRAWTATDCAAVMKSRHVLMGSAGQKLWRTRLVRALGPDLARRMIVAEGRTDTTIIPTSGEGTLRIAEADLDAVFLASEALDGESNSWAIHGARTASGLPLLAGDPHRLLEMPNVYSQIHLTCPEFDASGLSMPGIPGLFHFGQTDHVAWSITHAMADTQDLFLERFNGDRRHLTEGRWEPSELGESTIEVHGAASQRIDLTGTPRGPIVYGDPRSGLGVAIRWTGLDQPSRSLDAVLPLLRARDVDAVEDAMRAWVDPCNSFLSADVHGHISYLHRGRVPVRARANGLGVVPGWTGDHDWSGSIPFEELPRLRDPDVGYIATANNRITPDATAPYLGMDYAAPNRAQRVLAHLGALERATVTDMEAIHADTRSHAARTFQRAAARIASTPSRASALKHLEGWDARMSGDAPAATIFSVLRDELAAVLLEDGPLHALTELNPFPEQPLATTVRARIRSALPRLIEQDDTSILGARTWPDALADALDRTIEKLSGGLGSDASEWRWERVHRTETRHPLARRFPDANLDPPRVPLGGDADTVLAATADTGLGVQHASVARYAFDLGDRAKSAWVVPLGASGDPRSPHAYDQQHVWSEVRLIPFASGDEPVEVQELGSR